MPNLHGEAADDALEQSFADWLIDGDEYGEWPLPTLAEARTLPNDPASIAEMDAFIDGWWR